MKPEIVKTLKAKHAAGQAAVAKEELKKLKDSGTVKAKVLQDMSKDKSYGTAALASALFAQRKAAKEGNSMSTFVAIHPPSNRPPLSSPPTPLCS